jgi:hypothetical protein
MKRAKLSIVTLAVALMAACAWTASGEALTFDLACIVGNNSCPPSASYGSVALTSNTSGANTRVDLAVDLVGSGQKVLKLYLNFDESLFSNTDLFQLTSGKTVGVGVNDRRFPPFHTGNTGGFDLEITDTGNINEFDPYLDTLFITGKDLLPENFAFKESSGVLFAGVHIGNCGPNAPGTCLPGETGTNSIKVGAANDPLAPVPEPTTLLLWGSTAAGLGLLKRWRRRPHD